MQTLTRLRTAVRQRAFAATARVLAEFRPARPAGRRDDHLVIFKPDHIGDFVLASGAIRSAVRWWNASAKREVTLVVSTAAAPLARAEFPDCRVVAIPYSADFFRPNFVPALRALRAEIHAFPGDTLISFRHHLSILQDLMLSWIAPLDSYGTTGSELALEPGMPDSRSFRFSCSVPFPEAAGAGRCLEIEAHDAVLRLLPGGSNERLLADPRLSFVGASTGGGIAVFPNAQFPLRDYPTDALAEAVSQVARTTGLAVSAYAPASQSDSLAAFAGYLGKRAVPVQCVSPDSIADAAARIAAADLVIGMESAPAHIACAFDKPGVFIVGGGHIGVFAPWSRSPRQIWLQNELPCYGCNWQCSLDRPRCITDVEPGRVVDSALAALKLSSA